MIKPGRLRIKILGGLEEESGGEDDCQAGAVVLGKSRDHTIVVSKVSSSENGWRWLLQDIRWLCSIHVTSLHYNGGSWSVCFKVKLRQGENFRVHQIKWKDNRRVITHRQALQVEMLSGIITKVLNRYSIIDKSLLLESLNIIIVDLKL